MRLIDANALKDDFDALAYEDWNQGISISLADAYKKAANMVENMPTIEPFHNTTLSEVLKYIDNISEDEWQEFTACLECRGWYLERKTSKWCGGDFA